MPLIFKLQVPKKGHPCCSKCGKFVSNKAARTAVVCPYCYERL